MRQIQYLVLLAALAGLAACTDRVAPPPPLAGAPSADVLPGDPVIVAAGDLVCGTGTSSSSPCKHAETAALVTSIAPAAALLLGDLQYESATYSDFNTYYQPTWGAHKAISWPAPGNHEYQTSGASGYFDTSTGSGSRPAGQAPAGRGITASTWARGM